MAQISRIEERERLYDELIECLYSKWQWVHTGDKLDLQDKEQNRSYFGIPKSKKTLFRLLRNGTLRTVECKKIMMFFNSDLIIKIQHNNESQSHNNNSQDASHLCASQ